MNKEEQIEEMAKILAKSDDCGDCTNCVLGSWCPDISDATAIYNAGYRKQSVGRWVRNEDHNAYESPYFCSECLADCSDIQGENYCYNCGAKMTRKEGEGK